MKLKSLFLSAVLAMSAGVAAADDFNQSVTLTGTLPNLTAGFSVSHLEDALFTDTFTFSPSVAAGSFANGTISTIGFSNVANVDFYSVSLNGTNFVLGPNFVVEGGVLFPTPVSGPLVLVVTGYAGSASSYSGTLNVEVAPVPEPETYGMMLAGLGLVGFMARRRKQQAA